MWMLGYHQKSTIIIDFVLIFNKDDPAFQKMPQSVFPENNSIILHIKKILILKQN